MKNALHHVVLSDTVERPALAKGDEQVHCTRRRTEIGPAGPTFSLDIPVETSGALAEGAAALRAGDAVGVTGKGQWTGWTDCHGQKRTSLCVLARIIKCLDPGDSRSPLARKGADDAK